MWWNEEVKKAVKNKGEAYIKSLQKNLPREVRDSIEQEYKKCKKRVKRGNKEREEVSKCRLWKNVERKV